jgi:hypothetical protein
MTTNDVEISAMTALAAALEPLDDDARRRVLDWAFSRFAEPRASVGPSGGNATASEVGQSGQFESFAELYDVASPKTEKERALVAAFWVQVCVGESNFPAQILNSNLKDLGRGVSNITDALDTLKDDKPALILQLRKGGSSKQARKTYRLTQEGAKRVQLMISKEAL